MPEPGGPEGIRYHDPPRDAGTGGFGMMLNLKWMTFLLALVITGVAKYLGASVDPFLLFACSWAGCMALMILVIVAEGAIRRKKDAEKKVDGPGPGGK